MKTKSVFAFINTLLLEYSYIHLFINFYGYFYIAMAELSRCDRAVCPTKLKIFII